jgi:hypothetical protein
MTKARVFAGTSALVEYLKLRKLRSGPDLIKAGGLKKTLSSAKGSNIHLAAQFEVSRT